MYLDGKPVLYIIDSLTIFQATRFLKDIFIKTIWDIL